MVFEVDVQLGWWDTTVWNPIYKTAPVGRFTWPPPRTTYSKAMYRFKKRVEEELWPHYDYVFMQECGVMTDDYHNSVFRSDDNCLNILAHNA